VALTVYRNVAHVRPGVRPIRFRTLFVNKSYRRYAVCRTTPVVAYVRLLMSYDRLRACDTTYSRRVSQIYHRPYAKSHVRNIAVTRYSGASTFYGNIFHEQRHRLHPVTAKQVCTLSFLALSFICRRFSPTVSEKHGEEVRYCR